MNPRRVHIVGAGLAGLSAALQLTLAGENVSLYEAAPFAGGRSRSFFDRELDCRIDNGSHLVLSGNAAIHDYLYLTEAAASMGGPGKPDFPFMDLKTGTRWIVSMNQGVIPWWLFNARRRVPGTKLSNYLSFLKVMMADDRARVAGQLDTSTVLYQRFWEPLTIGVLNTEPEFASASLLANVLKQSFALGGKACIPLIPKEGLSETFVDPCLAILKKHDVDINFNHRLGAIKASDEATSTSKKELNELHFNNGTIVELGLHDWVIFALPAWVMKGLMPELRIPDEFRSIINAHFRIENVIEPLGFRGLVGGIAEWVFVRDKVLSVTVSCAERYGDYPVRDMAFYLWRDVARVYDLDPEKLPPHRIFKEKFATFAATPDQNRRRPLAYMNWKNVALAGEWTATELPSTIEGAVRSGVKAAQVVLRWT